MIGPRMILRFFVAIVLLSVNMAGMTIVSGETDDSHVVTLTIAVLEPTVEYVSGQTVISIEGWGTTSEPGTKILPERTFYIPMGEKIAEIKGYDLIGMKSFDSEFEIQEVPYPQTNGFRPDIMNNDNVKKTVRDLGNIDVGGHMFKMIRVSPFIADGKSVSYPVRIEIDMEMDDIPMKDSVIIPEDLQDPTVEEVEYHQPLWNGAGVSPPNVWKSSVYHNTVPDTECLIITSSTLNNSLQPLAGWKTQRGVYTRVVETSWIYNNFNGNDNQEKIRNCIKSFYSNEELKWVILGGDHSVVPTRMAYVPDGYDDSGTDGSTVPADGYYGDIVGTGHTPYDWDGDNDGNYGEYSVDGIDLSMEVYVGRLSATSSTAMGSLVTNILNYEKNPPSGNWFNSTVLAGAYSNYITSTQSATDEAKLKEEIRKDFLDGGDYLNYTLYEGSGIAPSSYPKNASLTTSNLVSAIDSGATIVNLAGHGSNTGIYRRIWSSDTNGNGYCDSGEYYDTAYYSTSASQTNGGMKPLFYNDACNNGNFDSTWCLTEDIVRDVGIGAVGSGRVSWYAVGWSPGSDGGYYNQGHDYRFWEQYANGAYQPGKALALSHSDYITDKGAHDKYSWKNLLQYNLIGDPEIPIYNRTPQQLNVTYSDPIPTPGNQTIEVKDSDGNAIKGAVVCLMNATSFYATATTDSNGKAVINMPELTVLANLTVTGRNLKPFITTVAIGTDDDLPEFGMTSFTGNSTTGDDFTIGQMVTDNVEVVNVTIRYAWNSIEPDSWSNNSMVFDGNSWLFNSTHPNNSTDPLWLSIGARDRAGNWNNTQWTSFAITDNDKPIFLQDNTSFVATTGDPFILACMIDDNIGISDSKVNFSINSGPWNEITMSGTGYARQITIDLPIDSMGFINYHFNFTDTSGNSNESTTFYRQIDDNDRPVLLEDRTILPPRTNNETEFDIMATDNMGISNAYLLFREAGQTEINLTMTSMDGENFTRSVLMPRDRISEIIYQYVIIDSSGNVFKSHHYNTTIIDDDKPYVNNIMTDPVMTTGDTFHMAVEADDNIDVASVSLALEYNGGLETDVSLVYNSTSGNWELEMVQPTSIVGPVNMTLTVTDTSGNSITTSPFSILLVDNDLPELISDRTMTDVDSGEDLTFEVLVEDNIGIEEVRLFSDQLFSGYRILSSSTRSSLYSLEIEIPLSISGLLVYHFEIEDTSGNLLVTGDLNTTVHDETLPEVSVVGFVLEGDDEIVDEFTTGETFSPIVIVQENIGLEPVRFDYRINEGILYSINMTVVSSGDHLWNLTCDIVMPSNVTGTVHYRVLAEDLSGNRRLLPWKTIELVDNDAPAFGTLSIEDTISTSSRVSGIIIHISDNIGVVEFDAYIEHYPDAIIDLDLVGTSIVGYIEMTESFVTDSTELVVVIDDGNNTAEIRIDLTILDGTDPSIVVIEKPDDISSSGEYQLKVSFDDNVEWTGATAMWIEADPSGSGSINIPVTMVNDNDAVIDLIPPGTGRWDVRITVEDAAGNEHVEVIEYTIEDDIEPTPIFDLGTEGYQVGDNLELDASSSEDTSGIASYTWVIVLPDGTEKVLDGMKVSLVLEMEGDYEITLELVDEYGNKGIRSQTITVTPMPDDGDEGSDADSWLLYIIIVASALLLIIVIAAVTIALRKKKQDEDDVEEDDEEELSWD